MKKIACVLIVVGFVLMSYSFIKASIEERYHAELEIIIHEALYGTLIYYYDGEFDYVCRIRPAIRETVTHRAIPNADGSIDMIVPKEMRMVKARLADLNKRYRKN